MSTATAGTESIDTEAAPPSATGLQPDVGFLLETVVSDVHGTILQIATLSLMTASCARLGSRLNLRACRHLMHDDSKIMLLALRYGQEIGLDKPTIDGLTRLYIDMGQAKMALAPLTDVEAFSSSQRQQLSGHGQTWRALANSAGGQLEGLGAIIKARLDAGYAQDFQTTRSFLARALEGDLLDIAVNGVLEAPKLRQRRRNPRLTLARSCSLRIGPTAHPAKLLDIAREGVGVSTRAPLEIGEDVVIALDDGRQLDATVARRQGSVAGLKLREPLEPSDPLFAT